MTLGDLDLINVANVRQPGSDLTLEHSNASWRKMASLLVLKQRLQITIECIGVSAPRNFIYSEFLNKVAVGSFISVRQL